MQPESAKMTDGWYKVTQEGLAGGLPKFHFVSANRDMHKASSVKLLQAIGYVYERVFIFTEEELKSHESNIRRKHHKP